MEGLEAAGRSGQPDTAASSHPYSAKYHQHVRLLTTLLISGAHVLTVWCLARLPPSDPLGGRRGRAAAGGAEPPW